MLTGVPDTLVTLIMLIGVIWLAGAAYIKLSDAADRKRATALAKRRTLLARSSHGQFYFK